MIINKLLPISAYVNNYSWYVNTPVSLINIRNFVMKSPPSVLANAYINR
jgi:hypothetical protein